MQITIKNYRGISEAVLNMDRICLVAGTNEAGKTSTAQAVAAALTGDPVPIPGVKKASAGLLVRSGTASGSIDMVGAAGSTNIGWPSAKVKTEGQGPFASHFAAGLISIATMDEKDRPRILAEYLSSAPVKEDLRKALADMNLAWFVKLSDVPDDIVVLKNGHPYTHPAVAEPYIPESKVLDQLWQLITEHGWDNAHAQIKEKGARLKGQWQETTGEQYGSKKAESWLPEAWEQDLMGQSETTLRAMSTDARDALEATIASDAVDESRIDALKVLAALVDERSKAHTMISEQTLDPAMQAQLVEGQSFVDSMAKIRDEMAETLKNMPQPDNTFHLPCPSCGVALELEAGKKLAIATVMSDEEKSTRMTAIDEMKKKVAKSTDGVNSHMANVSRINLQIRDFDSNKTKNLTEAKRLVEESKKAVAELKAISEKAKGSDIAYIEQCRTTLARADERLQAFIKKNNSDRIHIAIGQNQELIVKIAPEGIRGDVLVKALKAFNEKTVPLCKAAGWRPVGLDSDFTAEYGGTPYMLLSESAKFRVRTVLGLTMALMDKSEAVIVDAADILDKDGRNGLFKAINAAGLPALICMTIDKKELVPNLAKANLGASYWINGAVAEAV